MYLMYLKLTFKVHISYKLHLACYLTLLSIDPNIYDSTSFFDHICSDETRYTSGHYQNVSILCEDTQLFWWGVTVTNCCGGISCKLCTKITVYAVLVQSKVFCLL